MKHRLTGIWETRDVFLDGEKLSPEESQKIRNHSPDGFSWGYGGSGPAQLALAIVLKIKGSPEEHCLKIGYQNFKGEVIALLPQSDFNIEFEL